MFLATGCTQLLRGFHFVNLANQPLNSMKFSLILGLTNVKATLSASARQYDLAMHIIFHHADHR